MKIVCWNHKGGTSKSTLVAHVGFQAIERNVTLTVVDADRQCNTMSWLSGHNWDGSAEYTRGTVTVTTDDGAIGDGLTIVDAPPAFTFVEKHPTADVWIVPVGGRFSVDGAINVISSVHQVSKAARIVLVSSICDPNTRFGRIELDQVRKLDVEIFGLTIPKHDVVRKAEMMGQPAWRVPYGVRSTAAVNLQLFANWVLNGCSEKGVIRDKGI